jgi:hypothetical protein
MAFKRNKKRIDCKDISTYGGNNPCEENCVYIRSNSEKHIQKNDAHIVLGKDRPSSVFSSKSSEQNSVIDLVVGRLATMSIQEIIEEKRLNNDQTPIYCDVDFIHDSARIYISQKTDVDSNFGLSAGHIGAIADRSAIALKADSLRFISRGGGIKLITNTDAKDTYGSSKKDSATSAVPLKGIELNCGNETELTKIQPMVLGDNLALYLSEVQNKISRLNNIVTQFIKNQTDFNTIISTHNHLGSIRSGHVTTELSIPLQKYLPKVIAKTAIIMNDSTLLASDLELQKNDLNLTSPKHILSEYHKLN